MRCKQQAFIEDFDLYMLAGFVKFGVCCDRRDYPGSCRGAVSREEMSWPVVRSQPLLNNALSWTSLSQLLGWHFLQLWPQR